MDQTPLTFFLDENKTYDKKGAKEEKRQYTIQLTAIADGKTLPPLIIFPE